MYSASVIAEAAVNGALNGAVYSLVALGLTLIYGVLHIVNFAHGALLTLAMYAVWMLDGLGVNPYLATLPLVIIFFIAGYILYTFVISPSSHGSDSSFMLVTLGIAIALQGGLLAGFHADTRSIEGSGFDIIEVGPMLLSKARVHSAIGAAVLTTILWLGLTKTDLGRAIRAVAREQLGARLVGIDVRHIYALTFGIGCACLAVAACLLMPSFYVNPRAGESFVLVAFTIVVIGGMGSIPGAVVGAVIIGVIEGLGGLFMGDSLGQLGVFVLFISVLLFKPKGLFGNRA